MIVTSGFLAVWECQHGEVRAKDDFECDKCDKKYSRKGHLNRHIKSAHQNLFWFFVFFSPFISQRFLVWKYMFIIVSVLFSICYSWSIRVAFAIFWVTIDIPDFWAIFSWFWQFLRRFVVLVHCSCSLENAEHWICFAHTSDDILPHPS